MRPDLDLRAHLDTRGGGLVLALSCALIALVVTTAGLAQPFLSPARVSEAGLTLVAARSALGLVLPVLAVTVIAGGWSDGSIQQSVLLRPGRLGLLGGRLLAGAGLGAAVSLLALLLSLLMTWAGGTLLGDGADFAQVGGMLRGLGAVLAAQLLLGLAAGVLLQSVPVALVVAIALPILTALADPLAAVTGSDMLRTLLRALDLPGAALAAVSGTAGAPEVVAVLLLAVAPLAVGARRWCRREIP